MQEKSQKNTDISERISEMIDSLGVSVNYFATTLGYNRSQAIYDMINRKAKPSYDFFYKLLNSEYSEFIDVEYLITGKAKSITSTNKEDPNIDVYKSLLKEREQEIKELNREIGKLQLTVEQLKKGDQAASWGLAAEPKLEYKPKSSTKGA